MSYARDLLFGDGHIPAIKRIVGPTLLDIAPLDVDRKQATDLIVMRGLDTTIACRVRRPGYAESFPWEFTVRYRRDSGAQTEHEKFSRGWAHRFFYGHSNGDNDFARWLLLDLNAWRYHTNFHAPFLRPERKSNGDGTHFLAYDVRNFPADPQLVVASSHPVPVNTPT